MRRHVRSSTRPEIAGGGGARAPAPSPPHARLLKRAFRPSAPIPSSTRWGALLVRGQSVMRRGAEDSPDTPAVRCRPPRRARPARAGAL